MITEKHKNLILKQMVETLELPYSAYEKATARYEDLGEWFDRDASLLKDNNPHIFPQGSFRLGTAIWPLDKDEAYDLDLACELKAGVSKENNTQESLKAMVGQELQEYRLARGIKDELASKHRCWRLEYQDDQSFHMDIVPCIPAEESRRALIMESMQVAGADKHIAVSASQLTVAITDDRHDGYHRICSNWDISNPEGYAKWFEYQMNPGRMLALMEKAQVDEIPLFRRKSTLQRVIQLLKRHRDQMYKSDSDRNPISIIITTLAARAYDGEQNIEAALSTILSKMHGLVNAAQPRVPNPVDPDEDFADRWGMPQYAHLKLEENFFLWLRAAKADFANLVSSDDTKFITEIASEKFAARIDEVNLRTLLGIKTGASVHTPKEHVIRDSSKPWST